MALIGTAIYCTADNDRDELLNQCLASLKETVDFDQHELGLSINSFTPRTNEILGEYREIISHIIYNDENIGTAKAVNKIWRLRKPNQHLIKMDEDVVIYNYGWIEEMEEAIDRDPGIGLCALKRKDLAQNPNRDDDFKSELIMLPHTRGERWIVVEKAKDIIGTCVMHNSRLIDKVGGLYQMDGVYGFDDNFMSLRSTMAGFKNVFLPHIEIDHIDPGGTDYTKWKKDYADEMGAKFEEAQKSFLSGKLSIKFEL